MRPRLGLCCQFANEPHVRFHSTTAAASARRPRQEAWQKLFSLAIRNAGALREAIWACKRLQISAFRVSSNLLPLATHPDWLYGLGDLPEEARGTLRAAAVLARRADIRLSFHPDQFIVLGSPRPEVTEASLRELRLHGDLAELLGADVINLHAGGAYGDKSAALDRLARRLESLPSSVRSRLTLENDDRVFHVRDLLPLCRREGVPLAYDVHHHRCLPDGLTVAEATESALATWNREPLFHISSPKGGWSVPNPRRHADLINPADFPPQWRALRITVDVEAKLKEQAVLDLRSKLEL